MTYHCNGGPAAASSYTGQELADQSWHKYSLQWTPDILIWYIDDVQRFNTTSCIPNYPMFILANLAIGGNWPGAPNATTPFPAYMDIDYIRAYKYVPTGGVSLPGPGEGLPFSNAQVATRGRVTLSRPTVSDDIVTQGQNITCSVTLEVGPDGLSNAFVNAFVQPWMNSTSIFSKTFTGITVPANGSRTLSFDVTIPLNAADGFYRVGYGVFNEYWNVTMLWQSAASAIGVNVAVGAQSKSNCISFIIFIIISHSYASH